MSSCTHQFPSNLMSLIKTSKYVHLATATTDGIPSVSLMNYTYVPAEKSFKEKNPDNDDYIIFPTFDTTEKYVNIVSNPNVAMLFHDWIAANNLSMRKTLPSRSATPALKSGDATPGEQSAAGQTLSDLPETTPKAPSVLASSPGHPSKLLNLLQELNQSELNEMSASVRGYAIPIDPKSEESNYYKDILLRTNPDAGVFILGENTVIVKVKIQSAKVTDSENNITVYN